MSRWSRRRSVPTTTSIHRWLIPKFLVGSAKWCAMWWPRIALPQAVTGVRACVDQWVKS